ncbi:POTRA domain-containing protein [Parafilimonas sp.]|uniref:POTRA domain-containing protein n=1 Tax=Parafilimonas sp. TaxID=1969739 RepID=UPI0039E65321
MPDLHMKLLRVVLLMTFFCLVFAAAGSTQSDSSRHIMADSVVTDTGAKNNLPDTLFIAGISIYGNKKTKSYIIERELPFKQGSYITLGDLKKGLETGKQQLVNTTLFTDVAVYVENSYGQFVFITVFVKERWYILPLPYFKFIDANFNTWWVTYNHTLKRTNYGIKFLHNNISGRNDKLTTWLITGYSKQVAVKYERPFFDKQLKQGYQLFASYSNQGDINYATNKNKQQFLRPEGLPYMRKTLKMEGDYIYRPGLRVRHIFRAGYMYEQIADTAFALNPGYFGNGNKKASFPYIGYTFWYSNADYNFYPVKGLVSETSILHKGITKDMNLTQLVSINSYTIPLLPKTQIQVKEGGMLNLPFNQPFYNKGMFGYYGNISMRGYEYYVIDGDAGIVGRATLQQQLAGFTKKLGLGEKKEPYSFRVYGKLFADAGYVYNRHPGNSILNNKMLHSWGAGIDLVAPYDVIFKFDYSFNQLGESGIFIHLNTDF